MDKKIVPSEPSNKKSKEKVNLKDNSKDSKRDKKADASVDLVNALEKNHLLDSVDEEILALPMDKEQALTIFGLEAGFTSYQLENKLWQLSKRYRQSRDQKKLEEINLAYDVLTGNAARAGLETVVDRHSKKFLGKTKFQWKNYIYYNWIKYLAALVAIVLVGSVLHQIFFTPKEDVTVILAGYMVVDTDYISNYLMETLGFENPLINASNLVRDNSVEVNDPTTMYGPMTLMAYFTNKPEMIMYDRTTILYYLPQALPLDNFYEEFKTDHPDYDWQGIRVFTSSIAEHKEALKRQEMAQGLEPESVPEEEKITLEDKEVYIYGIEITDTEWIKALGVTSLWPDRPASLILTLGNMGENPEKGYRILTSILQDREIIKSKLEK